MEWVWTVCTVWVCTVWVCTVVMGPGTYTHSLVPAVRRLPPFPKLLSAASTKPEVRGREGGEVRRKVRGGGEVRRKGEEVRREVRGGGR